MTLQQFKQGDIIHRTKPITITVRNMGFGVGLQSDQDYSYIESALEVVDVKSGLLFYRRATDYLGRRTNEDDIHTLSLHRWDDDNWDYYPAEYLPEPQEAND